MTHEARYDVLFEPVQFGPKTAKNRFFAVPHCTNAGSDRPGMQAAFRAMKAEGGWAVACVEYCSVAPEVDDTPNISARLWDAGDARNLGRTAEAVHAAGGLAGIQLCYGGANAQALESRGTPRGPSPLPSEYAYQTYAEECDVDDIADLIECYARAARRARDVGFDYIELIGSDSHLPVQFLQRRYNKRTDDYGGSFDNRARFWLELLEALKASVGAECAVGNRIAIDSLQGPDGLELEEGLRFVERVTAEGLCDLWNVKISNLSGWGNDSGPSRFFKAHNQGWATKPVKAIADVPVVQVGRLTSPDDMVAVIRDGEADFIGGARPSIADPFLPRKIEQGRAEDIRECIGCNVCIAYFHLMAPIGCTQNATAMEEFRRGWHPEKFEPATDPCSVLVVGAGPAGLECARVLGLRGFEVHLLEAEAEIGGQMRDVARYPGLAEWGRVITWREGQIAKLSNVEVHRNARLDADAVMAYGAERVVIATGARWREDGLSGLTNEVIEGVSADDPAFCTPAQVMAGKAIGKRVVVLDDDGYFTGVAMAERLADRGCAVTLVTPFPEASPFSDNTLEADNLRRLLIEKHIEVRPLCWATRAEPAGEEVALSVVSNYGEGHALQFPPVPGRSPRAALGEPERLVCDTVVLVTARRSDDALYRELRARTAECAAHGLKAVLRIGDCRTPRLIQQAVFDAHRLAREFESADPMKPQPFIRERHIWGQESMPESAG